MIVTSAARTFFACAAPSADISVLLQLVENFDDGRFAHAGSRSNVGDPAALGGQQIEYEQMSLPVERVSGILKRTEGFSFEEPECQQEPNADIRTCGVRDARFGATGLPDSSRSVERTCETRQRDASLVDIPALERRFGAGTKLNEWVAKAQWDSEVAAQA